MKALNLLYSLTILGLLFFFLNCKKDKDISRISFVQIKTGEAFKQSAEEVILSGEISGIIEDEEVEILEFGHIFYLADVITFDTFTVISNDLPVKNGTYTTSIVGDSIASAKYVYQAYISFRKASIPNTTTIYGENNPPLTFFKPSFKISIEPEFVQNGVTLIVNGLIEDNAGVELVFGHIWSPDSTMIGSTNSTVFQDNQSTMLVTSTIENLGFCDSDLPLTYYFRTYAYPADENPPEPVYSEIIAVELKEDDFWQQRKSGPSARKGGIAFELNGEAYAGFGETDNGSLLNDLWKYNPETNDWMELSVGGMTPSPRKNAVFFVYENKGYIGFGEDESVVLADLWEFDPDPDMETWDSISLMPEAFAPRHSAFSFVIGGFAYVGGGISVPDFPANDCEVLADLWRIDLMNDVTEKIFPGTQFHLINHEEVGLDCSMDGDSLLIEGIRHCDNCGMPSNCMMNPSENCKIIETGNHCNDCNMLPVDTIIANADVPFVYRNNGMKFFKGIEPPFIAADISFDQNSIDIGYLLKRYGATAFSDGMSGYILFGKTVNPEFFPQGNIYDYYLKFDPANNSLTLKEFEGFSDGRKDRTYPFTFVIDDELYFGGGFDTTGNLTPIPIDFWKFNPSPTMNSSLFTSHTHCGFSGLGMGVGFTAPTQFNGKKRGYVGLGQEMGESSNRIYTYVPECSQ